MPELVVFQEQYSSKGVQVVGVAVDNLEPVKSFMQLNNINFPVVLGQNDAIELGKKNGGIAYQSYPTPQSSTKLAKPSMPNQEKFPSTSWRG